MLINKVLNYNYRNKNHEIKIARLLCFEYCEDRPFPGKKKNWAIKVYLTVDDYGIQDQCSGKQLIHSAGNVEYDFQVFLSLAWVVG